MERLADEEAGGGALIHFVCTNRDHLGSGGGYSTVHAARWAWCPSPEVVEDHEWSASKTPIQLAEARRANRTGDFHGKDADPAQDQIPKPDKATDGAPTTSGRSGRPKAQPKPRG